MHINAGFDQNHRARRKDLSYIKICTSQASRRHLFRDHSATDQGIDRVFERFVCRFQHSILVRCLVPLPFHRPLLQNYSSWHNYPSVALIYHNASGSTSILDSWHKYQEIPQFCRSTVLNVRLSDRINTFEADKSTISLPRALSMTIA